MKIRKKTEIILYSAVIILAFLGIEAVFLGISLSIDRFSLVALVALYIFFLFGQKKIKLSFNKLLYNIYIVLLLFWCFFFFMLYEGERLPYELFSLLGSLVFLHLSLEWKINGDIIRCFCIINVLSTFAFSYAYVTNSNMWHGLCMTILDCNPQHVGCWAFVFFAGNLICFDYFHNKFIKGINIIWMLHMFAIVIFTETRAAIVACSVILLLRIWPKVNVFKHKIVCFFVALIPSIIVYVAIALYDRGYGSINGILNGRERIWKECIELAGNAPLIGGYEEFFSIYPHNTFIEHILFFGYIIAIMFIVAVSIVLMVHIKKIQKIVNYDGLICFIGSMLMASQENAIFSLACGCVFTYVCSFVFVMAYEGESAKTESVFAQKWKKGLIRKIIRK